MTLPDLEAFFEEHGNMYTNDNGIEIHLSGAVWVSATIWKKAPVIFTLSLIVDDDDPELSEKLGFRSAEDIRKLDEAYLWYQYRKGLAKVYANMDDLFDMTVVFQQDDDRTYVSKDGVEEVLIDVLNEVSCEVDWFRTYIRNNASRWYVGAEERGNLVEAVV